MPHKHKRKRDAEADFDLPPTQRARSLPVKSQVAATTTVSAKKRGKSRHGSDDAPRAFRRLMAITKGKKLRSGLDDGNGAEPAPESAARGKGEVPRIRPGEDLRSFAVRVDAALPVSGLTHKTKVKDGKDELGLKIYRTRKERKMHILYDQWRAEERKIEEMKEDELEQAAERELDNDAAGITSFASLDTADTGLGGKSRRRGGNVDEDPWLELKRRRAETKPGLHDVAQAPPVLSKPASQLLRVSGAAVDVSNIPKSAGSLRRREELQTTRTDAIEAYRKMRRHKQARIDASRGSA